MADRLLPTASFKAFMLKRGEHTTNAVGSRCMNAELIQEMNQDLVDAWRALTDLLDQTIDLLQQNLVGQVVTMRNSLRGDAPCPAIDAVTLIPCRSRISTFSGELDQTQRARSQISSPRRTSSIPGRIQVSSLALLAQLRLIELPERCNSTLQAPI